MSFTITKDDFISNFENAHKLYEEYGVLKIEGYIPTKRIEKVREELKAVYDKIPDLTNVEFGYAGVRKHNDHETGKSLRVINPKYYKMFPEMISLIADDETLDNFLNHFYPPPNRKLLQVFATYEYKKVEQDSLPRNSWLHFDPYASLKFAVMLQDTTAINGALLAIPASHNEGKKIRENFMKHQTVFQKGIAHRFIDYQDIYESAYTEEQAIHIDVKAGDLLVLNTDNWHAGGIIQEDGEERMAIYYHNRQQ